MQELEDIISLIWVTIDHRMNTGNKLISSEKSIVFNFAWELQKTCQDRIELIDFETSLFQDFSDGQFLDLFVLYHREDQLIRIGIEFKYPNKKKGNSGQTQVRPKIINDIKRLTWLVTNRGIDLGCFLCVTNEKDYVNQGNYKKNRDFLTHHGLTYVKDSLLPANELYKQPVRAITDVTFNWNHIQKTQKKYEIVGAIYSFLKPIFMRNNGLESNTNL